MSEREKLRKALETWDTTSLRNEWSDMMREQDLTRQEMIDDLLDRDWFTDDPQVAREVIEGALGPNA
jgi:DNA-directed RNA polymerase specialized sigma24 family protein